MVMVELKTETLAVLISGLYCTSHSVNPMAIPESLWMDIAGKLEYFISNELWDFSKVSFEDFVTQNIFVYPTEMLDVETMEELTTNSLYWETDNGNVTLSVSLNIGEINDTG